MKILIFIEGTILMHLSGKNVSREERVRQSQAAGIQREEKNIAYETNTKAPEVAKGSVYDLASYIPINNVVKKLQSWVKQGAEICYLSSRRIKNELDTIKQILDKYHFPHTDNFYFRQQGEDYKDVAERLSPDILIEDDCESIGGEVEMTYTNIKAELKEKIKHITIKEFEGIDYLSENIENL